MKVARYCKTVARQLQERYRGKYRELWWAFVDLQKAFDSAKEHS